MKIGIYVGKIFKSTVGGGHVFEENFIDSLLNADISHKLVVYYLSSKNLYKNTDKIKFVNLQKKYPVLSILPIYKKKIFNLAVKKDNIDLVYYCTPKYSYTDKPYIFTLWDLGHRVMPLFPEVSLKKQYEKREVNFTQPLQRATMILVGNNEGKNNICTYYNVEPDKVNIVPMFTPRDIFELTPDNKIIEKLNIEKNKFIFYPAQFWAHKNHIRIVKAMKILKDKGNDLKVVFSGADKFNQNYIEDVANKLSVKDRVIFAGFTTREELIALYKNAKALVYASLLGPDNIPPLEAMALGCPVLASDIKGHIEQLGNNAEYFKATDEKDLADKIQQIDNLFSNSARLEKAKSLAEERNSDYYVKKAFEKIDELSKYFECWNN